MSGKKSVTSFSVVIVSLLVLAMAMGILCSCGEEEKPAEQAAPAEKELAPIKLAVVGPHSGDLASYGIPTVKAAELVVEHRNAMNGVNGHKIELIVEDDVCKPEVATNTATRSLTEKSMWFWGISAVVPPRRLWVFTKIPD